MQENRHQRKFAELSARPGVKGDCFSEQRQRITLSSLPLNGRHIILALKTDAPHDNHLLDLGTSWLRPPFTDAVAGEGVGVWHRRRRFQASEGRGGASGTPSSWAELFPLSSPKPHPDKKTAAKPWA